MIFNEDLARKNRAEKLQISGDQWAWVLPEIDNGRKMIAHARGTEMVWIHPDGDTMEASVFNQWKPICDQRGLMIIAPKAQKIGGWSPNEAEFVKGALEQFAGQYPVDPGRVFLHSFSSGGRFAYRLAFKYRELIHGLAMVAAPLREPPPENDPDYRLQFHLLCGEIDNLYRAVQQTVGGLRRLKFPVSFRSIAGRDHKYPPNEQVREISRWADCLDRI